MALKPPEPWLSFLDEIDRHLSEPTFLHCCGGFAMTQCYGIDRATSDIDLSNDYAEGGKRRDFACAEGFGTA